MAIAGHVLGWVAQVLSHKYAERRAPSLFDSFFQSIGLAPLFVWLEMLFALGYRPQLARRINRNAANAIAIWRRGQSKTASAR